MNYYNLRRRNLISDILTPFNKGGYDIKHQGVRRQPIGSLHHRYQRYQPYNTLPTKNQADNGRAYTFVPPMKSLRHDSHRYNLVSRTAAAIGLMLFNAKVGLVKLVRAAKPHTAGRLGTTRRTSSRLKLAVPALLIVLSLLWLAHLFPSTHQGRGRPAPAQLIPVRPLSASNQGSSGGSSSSANNGAGTPTINGGGLSSSAGASGAQNLSSTTPLTGGMGGGGSTTTATGSGTSTTSSTSSSGLLPLTLTVPSTSTTVDNKTILDSSGTTLTVN